MAAIFIYVPVKAFQKFCLSLQKMFPANKIKDSRKQLEDSVTEELLIKHMPRAVKSLCQGFKHITCSCVLICEVMRRRAWNRKCAVITRKLIGVARSEAGVAATGVGGGLEAWITCSADAM